MLSLDSDDGRHHDSYHCTLSAKSSEEHEKDAQERLGEAAKWTEPNAWVGHLLDLFQYLYIIGASGVFVSLPGIPHMMQNAWLTSQVTLAWQFDYNSQHSAYLGTRPAASTTQQKVVMIPSLASLPSFQPPTDTYAIGALIFCVLG